MTVPPAPQDGADPKMWRRFVSEMNLRGASDLYLYLTPDGRGGDAMIADALWCLCGREAYIVLGDETVCPFCYLTQLVEIGLEPEWADRMAMLLQQRKAEEDRRLARIVFGGAPWTLDVTETRPGDET